MFLFDGDMVLIARRYKVGLSSRTPNGSLVVPAEDVGVRSS